MSYNTDQEAKRHRAAFIVAIICTLLIAWKVYGDEPRFEVVNRTTPAFEVVNKTPAPAPQRDTFRASDNLWYERHPDGVYRLVPGQPIAAPAVAVPPPFVGAFGASCLPSG